jgi:hypothetical protein
MARVLPIPTVLLSLVFAAFMASSAANAQDDHVGGSPLSMEPQSANVPDEQLQSWVEQVVLGPQYGGNGPVLSRWARSPSLSALGGTAEQQQIVSDVVAHINKTLALTPIKAIELLPVGRMDADILVYLVPQDSFSSIAEKHNFKYVQGNVGYFWTFWDDAHQLTHAYVLVAADKLNGKSFRHHVLVDIARSLGPMNCSPTYSDSVFYRKGETSGNTQELSYRDRVLLWLVFNLIQPGDGQAEVRAAFQQHWPKK